jgi:hypothetical protein
LQFDEIDSDPEEEAFVTQLAEKMMNQHAGGKANFDDEDPDMEGWDDDSDDGDDNSIGGSENSKDSVDPLEEEEDDDMDSFMEHDGDSSGAEEPSIDGGFDNEDDDSGNFLLEETQRKINNNDQGNAEVSKNSNQKKKGKKERPSEAFEDADDYEELIAKAWAERDMHKKRKLTEEDDVKEVKIIMEGVGNVQGKKKKK